MFDGRIAAGSIFYANRTSAYTGFAQETVPLNLIHCPINHSEAEEECFTRALLMDREDGPDFCAEYKDNAVSSVSTQFAERHTGTLKNWLIRKGGVQREHIKG